MERISISKKLGSEFFTTDGLRKLTGCYSWDFCRVIVKELIDNALDEVETREHGIIITSVSNDSFSIWDNGNGIKEEIVKRILDPDNRTSTKREYISPSRGRQGNALKTVMGIPCVWGIEGTQIIIESCGIKHSISHQKDYADNVELFHQVESSDITNGTLITVFWNEIKEKVTPMIENIKVFNPHVSILSVKNTELNLSTILQLSENLPSKNTLGFEKVRLNDPMDINWYDYDSFLKLLSEYEKSYPQMKFRLTNGMDKSNSFLGLFHKLTNYRSQQKSLPEDFKSVKLLGEIKSFTKNSLEELLDHLQVTVKLSKNSIDRLGSIGEDNFKSIDGFGYFPCGYVKKTDNQNSLVVELFAVRIDDYEHDGVINWGVNYTACYEEINFNGYDENSVKIKDVIRKLKKQKNIVYVHLIHPNFAYKDYSKNQIHFTEEQLNIISKAFSSLYHKVGKKETIEDKKTEDKEEKKEKVRPQKIDLKDILLDIAEDIYKKKSENGAYILTMRNFFYPVRDEIKKKYGYCVNRNNESYSDWGDSTKSANNYARLRKVIQELMDDELISLPTLVSKPRGYLYEPYSDIEIKMGTKQVDDYSISDRQYQGLLYIEKDNPLLQLRQAKIGQKYDILLCSGEGYAVRAVKTLLRKCNHKDFKIFCLHDADPSGYSIYQDLSNKCPNVEIIDFGLFIEEGINDLGMIPEKFKESKEWKWEWLKLTDTEKKLFLEEKKRIEISNMSPRMFIDWVDKKLSQYLPEKKIPDNQELIEEIKPVLVSSIKRDGKQYHSVLENELKETALKGLRKEMKKVLRPFRRKEERIVKKLMLGRLKPQVDNVIEGKIKELLDSDYVEMVKDKLTKNPYQSWTNTIDGIINTVISDNLPQLKKEIKSIVSKEE